MPKRPLDKPYSGSLAKPVPDLSWTPEELKSLLGARLECLFGHYEIAEGPDMCMQLAFELACDHVPGFQFAKPLGAHPYPPDDDITIYWALKEAKKNGRSIAQAARDLADWGAFQGRLRGLSGKSIRERYYRLRRDPKFLKRIVAGLEAEIVRSGEKVIEGKDYRATVLDDGEVRVEKLC